MTKKSETPKLDLSDFDRFLNNDVFVSGRMLYLGSGGKTKTEEHEDTVDANMAENIIKALNIFDLFDDNIPVTLLLNTQGGDYYHGMAIYDAIKECSKPTQIFGYGNIMSMGSIIFQAADKRILLPNSTMMIHYGQGSYSGHEKDFQATAKEGKRITKLSNNIFLEKIRQKHPKMTEKEFDKFIAYDKYLSPKEAVNLGLADKIKMPSKIIKNKRKSK